MVHYLEVVVNDSGPTVFITHYLSLMTFLFMIVYLMWYLARRVRISYPDSTRGVDGHACLHLVVICIFHLFVLIIQGVGVGCAPWQRPRPRLRRSSESRACAPEDSSLLTVFTHYSLSIYDCIYNMIRSGSGFSNLSFIYDCLYNVISKGWDFVPWRRPQPRPQRSRASRACAPEDSSLMTSYFLLIIYLWLYT